MFRASVVRIVLASAPADSEEQPGAPDVVVLQGQVCLANLVAGLGQFALGLVQRLVERVHRIVQRLAQRDQKVKKKVCIM